MRLISWNVNGLRAVVKKGFDEAFAALDADVFALQETKLQEGQIELDLPGYVQNWSYAEKKGYSGTAVFSREEPLQVVHHVGTTPASRFLQNSRNAASQAMRCSRRASSGWALGV